MPFGLKSAGTTYQRMIMKMFDDMVVKNKEESNHIRDLTKVFAIFRTQKRRLNVVKCVFEVSSGKFLGYLVIRRGIKENPEQITAINDLVSL